jgi:hypothetical protein
MAAQQQTAASALYLAIPNYASYDGASPNYGISSADGTIFNQMVNVPNPAMLEKDVAEHAGQLLKEQTAETKRHQRESTEISKANLAIKLYQAQQQTEITLAKEAIEIIKQSA